MSFGSSRTSSGGSTTISSVFAHGGRQLSAKLQSASLNKWLLRDREISSMKGQGLVR